MGDGRAMLGGCATGLGVAGLTVLFEKVVLKIAYAAAQPRERVAPAKRLLIEAGNFVATHLIFLLAIELVACFVGAFVLARLRERKAQQRGAPPPGRTDWSGLVCIRGRTAPPASGRLPGGH